MTEKPFLTGTPSLPATLNRRIGAFITRWAYLENHLQRTCYLLLGVSMEQGRLMVQEHRSSERPIRIIELAHLAGVKVDEVLLRSMSKRMGDIVDIRDCVAHGVWFYSPDHREYALSVTKGSWDNRPHVPTVLRKKKVTPEGRLINGTDLQSLCDDVDAIIADSRHCYESIRAQYQPSSDR